MAFNVGNYVKDNAKSAVTRMVDSVTQTASNGRSNSTKSVAASVAQQLIDVGASYESVSAYACSKTDNIVSGASDEVYAMAGNNPQRASKADLKSLRRSTEDTSTYLDHINPQTSIARAKADNTADIIVVV